MPPPTGVVSGPLMATLNSRMASPETSLMEVLVDSETVHLALGGETGVALTEDYRGVEVLSAYGRFELDEFGWAVMAEIDRAEVFEAVSRARLSIPVLGVLFYALSILSLWLVSASGLELSDLSAIDAGDPPPS